MSLVIVAVLAFFLGVSTTIAVQKIVEWWSQGLGP
jgi:hypothetical protein